MASPVIKSFMWRSPSSGTSSKETETRKTRFQSETAAQGLTCRARQLSARAAICQPGQDNAPSPRRGCASAHLFRRVYLKFGWPYKPVCQAWDKLIGHAAYQMPTVRKRGFRPGRFVPRLRLPDCERRNRAAKREIAPVPGRSAAATDYSGLQPRPGRSSARRTR